MKSRRYRIIVSVCGAVLLAASPLTAWAVDDVPPEPVPVSPVIITEVQTGATTASDEFIELYNASDEAVDITGWQLRTAAVAAPGTTLTGVSAKFATIESLESGPVLLAPGAYYGLKLATADASIPADQAYTTGLTKTEKALALFAPNTETCKFEVRDAVAWVSADAVADGEGRALIASANKDILLARYQDETGAYVDTDDNLHDFFINPAVASGALQPRIAIGATPKQANALLLPAENIAVTGYQSQLSEVDMVDCVVPVPPEEEPPTDTPQEELPESPPAVIETPEPEQEMDTQQQPTIPAGNVGLKSPMLSEFLPNPASPQTDKADEFIELYNPNDAYFDLSSYVLEVGLTTTRRYIIPAGTKIAPRTFLAFFSTQSSLALSNNGGRVTLLDPLGRTLATSDVYGTAKDGQAWVFANGIWQWTTKPTPNALNVVATPVVKSKSTTKKSTKVSAASANKTGASGTTAGQSSEEDVERAAVLAASSSTSLHPGALALIAVSAVLYGAYEYRRDVANRIYQFRTNRATRRALRQNAEGR